MKFGILNIMSGAAGLAAAKRRRATGVQKPQTPQNSVKLRNGERDSPLPSPTPTPSHSPSNITPLVLLQSHDTKLKEINQMVEEHVENISGLNNNVTELHNTVSNIKNDTTDFIKEEVIKMWAENDNDKRMEQLEKEHTELKQMLLKLQTFAIETNLEVMKIKTIDTLDTTDKADLMEN